MDAITMTKAELNAVPLVSIEALRGTTIEGVIIIPSRRVCRDAGYREMDYVLYTPSGDGLPGVSSLCKVRGNALINIRGGAGDGYLVDTLSSGCIRIFSNTGFVVTQIHPNLGLEALRRRNSQQSRTRTALPPLSATTFRSMMVTSTAEVHEV